MTQSDLELLGHLVFSEGAIRRSTATMRSEFPTICYIDIVGASWMVNGTQSLGWQDILLLRQPVPFGTWSV